jgi:spore coat polysaccharide biosynthesis protein SpsF
MQLVGDRPILHHLIRQLRRVQALDEIVLAISEGPSQSIFIDFAKKEGLPYVIGPEKDVLGRLIMAADAVGADIALRTTTENPYIYWENIDELIRLHVENNADLTVTEKLPLGAFLEIISVDALRKSHRHGEDRHRSELCSLFIAENPDLFTIQRLDVPPEFQRPDIRLTVDTPQDLIVVREIWSALHQKDELIRLADIIKFLDAHPEISQFNAGENTLYLWK